ncbi:MAG TPA: hypothetical protein VGO61_23030 [Steroidobacteraceae bacterium]|jgi:hypothetical protein|nr:hypothetical protein [Steroidobacteraceae bacterium]
MNARSEEAVGPNYDSQKMLEARQHTFRAIERIAASVRPGMRESEAVVTPRPATCARCSIRFAGGDLWVLEIQIHHPERPFGAFFEDLLLESRRWNGP